MRRNKGKNKDRDSLPIKDGRGTKEQRRDEEIIDTAAKGMYRSGSNDPAWYSRSPQLVKDVASFPFSFPTGQEFVLGINSDPIKIPGVMCIGTGIAIGHAQGDLADPINVAATNLYSEIRQANSGHANYEAADLMMYIICMDSLYAFHAWLRRVYGTAMAYTPTNKYYPRGVLAAMNVDADDVFENLAQLRANINLFARMLSSYRIPSKFSYITRHQWMYNSLFVDSTNSKAQTYLFNLDNAWQFDNTATTGTRLIMIDIASSGSMTVAKMSQIWNNMFTAIQNDEDVNIMSGDILKAFPNDILIAPEIPENYTVLPTYDERVLMQIHNSISCGTAGFFSQEGQIVQDPSINGGAITAVYNLGTLKPVTDGPYGWVTGILDRQLINYYKDDVTPDDMMEATRLTGAGNVQTHNGVDGNAYYMVRYPYIGSEFVTTYRMVVLFAGDSVSQWKKIEFTNTFEYLNSLTVGDTMSHLVDVIGYTSQFDWAPKILVVGASAPQAYNGMFADVAVYTIVQQDSLAMMHRVALLSELDYR